MAVFREIEEVFWSHQWQKHFVNVTRIRFR